MSHKKHENIIKGRSYPKDDGWLVIAYYHKSHSIAYFTTSEKKRQEIFRNLFKVSEKERPQSVTIRPICGGITVL